MRGAKQVFLTLALYRKRARGVIVALRATTVSYEYPAKVAELVDALDLGSSGVTRESSSLSFRTNWLDTVRCR